MKNFTLTYNNAIIEVYTFFDKITGKFKIKFINPLSTNERYEMIESAASFYPENEPDAETLRNYDKLVNIYNNHQSDIDEYLYCSDDNQIFDLKEMYNDFED